MYTKSNRLYWLFLVLVFTIVTPLTPAADAAGGFASQTPSTERYTVRADDTLWDIAARYRITVAQLAAANPGVRPDALRPGQTLMIPTETRTPASIVHVVKANDTLWDIASLYGVEMSDLLTANPGVDPRRLSIGQQLQVPGIRQEVLAASPQSEPEAGQAETTLPLAAPAAAAGTQPPTSEISPMALEVLGMINEKRVAGGRPALLWNAALAAAAQAHADDCARRNRGSHIGTDGSKLPARLQRAGYTPKWSGENWANARSASQAMAMWWDEPRGADPHVQNIMAGRATEIGIGVAKGSWGYYFITDFGSR